MTEGLFDVFYLVGVLPCHGRGAMHHGQLVPHVLDMQLTAAYLYGRPADVPETDPRVVLLLLILHRPAATNGMQIV